MTDRTAAYQTIFVALCDLADDTDWLFAPYDGTDPDVPVFPHAATLLVALHDLALLVDDDDPTSLAHDITATWNRLSADYDTAADRLPERADR